MKRLLIFLVLSFLAVLVLPVPASAQGEDDQYLCFPYHKPILKNVDKKSPIVLASRQGNVKEVKHLIAAGIDVNTGLNTKIESTKKISTDTSSLSKSDVLVFEPTNDSNNRFEEPLFPPLIAAAKNGHTEVVKLLLKAGADVNMGEIRESVYHTALDYAVQNNHIDIVKLLLKKEIDNLARHSALMIALNNDKYIEIAKLMLKAESNYKAKEKDVKCNFVKGLINYSLPKFAEKGQSEIVKLLLEAGAYVDAQDEFGGTALMSATIAGKAEVVKLLLSAGAKDEAAAALKSAVKDGYSEIVKLLLEAGAVKSVQDLNEALLSAVEKGYTEIVKFLIKAGANAKGSRALTLAMSNNRKDIAKLLLTTRTDKEDRKEAITYALRDLEIFKMIFKAGVDVNAVYGHTKWYGGCTPNNSHCSDYVQNYKYSLLFMALNMQANSQKEEKQRQEIIKILKQAGAKE